MLKYCTLLLLILLCSPAPTPLRLGSDNSLNDITITFDADSGSYVIGMNQYNTANAVTLCLRERPLVSSTEGCSLGIKGTGNYQCISITQNMTQIWTMTPSYVRSNVYTFSPFLETSDASQPTWTISLYGNITINGSLVSHDMITNYLGIFEVLSSTDVDFTDPKLKIQRNYMTTGFGYKDPTTGYTYYWVDSDNVLLQRNAYCFLHEGVYNLVFTGGVVRDGIPMYMIGLVNISPGLAKSYLLWEGISYSRDKVLRDMVGFYPYKGYCDDLYSIYASAPFLDTSTNINGTQDYSFIATSDSLYTSGLGSFYYIQVYRYYDTGDVISDEVLQFKIKNEFCFTLYITEEAETDTSGEYLYTDKRYKHEFLKCFSPDLELSLPYLSPVLMVVAVLLMQL